MSSGRLPPSLHHAASAPAAPVVAANNPFEPPASGANPFDDDYGNYFDDAFDNGTNNIETALETNTYMRQMQTQVFDDSRVQELKTRADQAREDAEATKKLEDDIDDLNEIMVDLTQLVHTQHEMVDSIEEQVERSSVQVSQGHQQLQKAVRNNQAKYPFVAAAIGGVALGGPVGVVAGSAIAGIAAAVGGAFAGEWWRSRTAAPSALATF